MAKMFDSLEALERYVMSAAEKTMREDMHKESVRYQQSELDTTVYNAYEPVEYERRHGNLGLADPQNMISNIVNRSSKYFTYTFENITRGKGAPTKYIGGIVEEGHKKTGGYDYPTDPAFTDPRPFMQNTLDRIEESRVHEKVLREGLKKRL